MELTNENRIFLTQSELADRWRVAPSSIKNWREKGEICYFQLPGSSRVLYPIEAIEEIERKFTKHTKEVVKRGDKKTEIKRKMPGMSSRPKKEWRI